MLGNKIAPLAICFALFAAAVCGHTRAHQAINAAAHSSAKTLASPRGAPRPERPPKTVRVRLVEVETNADVVDWPSPGAEIIIKAGSVTLNKKTDDEGLAVFDAVPCGQPLVITRKGAATLA